MTFTIIIKDSHDKQPVAALPIEARDLEELISRLETPRTQLKEFVPLPQGGPLRLTREQQNARWKERAAAHDWNNCHATSAFAALYNVSDQTARNVKARYVK